MQIAGSRCGTCAQNVGIVREGVACTACGIVYHTACLTILECPACGRSLLSGHEAHALTRADGRRRAERPTSVTVIGRLGYVGVPLSAAFVLAGVSQMTVDAADGLLMIVGGLLMGVLCIVLPSALLAGRNWARRFLLWVTPVALAVEIVIGDNGFLEPGFSWWRSVAAWAVYGIHLYALTRPKANAFFGEDVRANTTTAA